MEIKEFVNKHNLHDSYFETVDYDSKKQELVCKINFAFWLQDDFIEGRKENGIITVVFTEITEYNCSINNPAGNFIGIIEATFISDSEIIINLLDDKTNSFYEMKIKCKDVKVVNE